MHTRVKPILRGATGAMLAAIALAVLGSASAQQRDLQSYDVELVIFRHLAANATPEQHRLAAELGSRSAFPDSDAETLEPPAEHALAGSTENIQKLPAAKRQLTAIEEALRRSRNYRPLAHIGWSQPGYPINEAHFLPLESFVPASSGLTGRIALARGRYLHLTVDLAYVDPEADSASSVRHVLKQSRRMRSNERHYIDHPEIGVIAIVTPSAN